jgi:DNA-directed RNA polymerase subunit omega
MNAQLLAGASKVIPLTELLVNVVSRRVHQLSRGHRPLIAAPPGMGMADIALSEIIAGKLTSAPADPLGDVIALPVLGESRKKAA